jgi:squalene synthase HpnC
MRRSARTRSRARPTPARAHPGTRMAVDGHYENFPVASWLIPKAQRPLVAALYRYARGADDIADEGEATDALRLERLSLVKNGVKSIFQGLSTDNEIAKYAQLIRAMNVEGITEKPFFALISAFEQDVVKKRYASRLELLDYADRSANPVGRLMLLFFGVRSESANCASDAICTALQLINFWQDAKVDIAKGRIYVPHEEFVHHGVDDTDFPSHPKHRALMRAQCEHAREMLWSGASLLRELRGRFRYEIAFTIAGGARILEKIAANDYDVTSRPTLRWYDSLRLLRLAMRALRLSKNTTPPAPLIDREKQ